MYKYHSVSDWEQNFRHRIFRILDKENMSARELSLILGKDKSYMSRMLNGHINPSLTMIFDIICALNMTPDEFFAFFRENVDDDIRDLTFRISKLDKDEQNQVLELVEGFEKAKQN